MKFAAYLLNYSEGMSREDLNEKLLSMVNNPKNKA
jgi:hypothetical protein